MLELTREQIGLLSLIIREPGPSLREMFEDATYYGASRDHLREDYLRLLSERLIWPLGHISYRSHFFPTSCVVSPKGKSHFDYINQNFPEQIPEVDILGCLDLQRADEDQIVKNWPQLKEMDKEEKGQLSDAYYFIAEELPEKAFCLPKTDLYYAAAIGYASLNENRRFALAIRKYFKILVEESNYLAVFTGFYIVLGEFKENTEVVIETIWIFVKDIGDKVGQNDLQEPASVQELKAILNTILSWATHLGEKFQLKTPDTNYMAALNNRSEDLLSLAFVIQRRDLFHLALLVNQNLLGLIDDLLMFQGESLEVKYNNKFTGKQSFLGHIFYKLSACESLIYLPGELREKAYKTLRDVLRILWSGIVRPIYNINRSTDEESRNYMLMFSVIGRSTEDLTEKILPYFVRLIEYVNIAQKHVPKDEDNKEIIKENEIALELEPGMKKVLELLSQLVANNINSDLQTLPVLLEINEKINNLMGLGLGSLVWLESIWKALINNQIMLNELEKKMGDGLYELKKDIGRWMDKISHSTIDKEDKKGLLAELGEVIKMNNAAKMAISIPLIPGILTYQHELGINVDIDKWFKKIKAAFKD